MPERQPFHSSPGNSQKPAGVDHSGPVFPLLRYAHVFASVVREILEMKYLREVSRYPLTLPQFNLLKLISVDGHHHVGQIADFLGVSPPAATKNIDKLERLGLVVRSQAKDDRRATLLSSSAKGRQLVDDYEALKAERLTPVLEEFSVGELQVLSRLLERFSLCLIRREDSEGGLCFRCSAYWDDHCPVSHIRGGCPYEEIRQRRERQGSEKEI